MVLGIVVLTCWFDEKISVLHPGFGLFGNPKFQIHFNVGFLKKGFGIIAGVEKRHGEPTVRPLLKIWSRRQR